MADAHHSGSFFLADTALGMDRFANIGYRDQALDADFTRFFVDREFDHSHPHFPENRQSIIGNGRTGIAAANELPPGPFAESAFQCLFKCDPSLAANKKPILNLDLVL